MKKRVVFIFVLIFTLLCFASCALLNDGNKPIEDKSSITKESDLSESKEQNESEEKPSNGDETTNANEQTPNEQTPNEQSNGNGQTNGNGQGDPSDKPSTDNGASEKPAENEPKADDSANYYADLFDARNKVALSIEMSDAELKKINDDYMRNTYRMADKLTITITYSDGKTLSRSIEEVGVRMKGNTSRKTFFEDGTIENNVHYKLSFDETFDDELEYEESERKVWESSKARSARKDRTFFGLGGLELKFNREFDASYSREIYASEVYKENGIYAQKINLGVLTFENQSASSDVDALYKIYEPVDKYFIHRYFEKGNDDGDLYKATYGSGTGMPTLNQSESDGAFGVNKEIYKNDKVITYDLKTNKKKSKHLQMSEFLSWINGSEDDLSATVKDYMNEDYFYTFLAIQYLSGDWDNFLYDSNNYYLYFANDGKAYFIPYDMDRTFGIQAKDHDMAHLTSTDRWNLQGDENISNLLWKTIYKEGSVAREKFLAKVEALAGSVLDMSAFRSVYDKVFANYGADFAIDLGNAPSDRNNATESYFTNKANALQ